jgi:hypothetical protein
MESRLLARFSASGWHREKTMTEMKAGTQPNWDQADFTKGDSSSEWVKGAINQLHDLRLEHMKETAPDRTRCIGSSATINRTARGKAGELLTVGKGEEGRSRARLRNVV